MDYALTTNQNVANAIREFKTVTHTLKCNLFANWETPRDTHPDNKMFYVIYSYRISFPIWAWHRETDQWFGHKETYSPTTQRHKKITFPINPTKPIIYLNSSGYLSCLIERGPADYIRFVSLPLPQIRLATGAAV